VLPNPPLRRSVRQTKPTRKVAGKDNKVILTQGIDGGVNVDYFQKIESWPF
jgi:hypothetical protein